MRIQHNIPAMNAYRNYNGNTKALQANLQKLSSGYKINKAGDDAAGLAISEKMRAQITGLEVAQKNAKDGISLVQTAEGAMTEIHTMLNRMFSLAEQSANGTYADDVDREQLNNEFQKLTTEIDRIADATNFNGKKLLNGELAGSSSKGASNLVTTSLTATKIAANKAKYATDVIAANGTVATASEHGVISLSFEDKDGNVQNIRYEVTFGKDSGGTASKGAYIGKDLVADLAAVSKIDGGDVVNILNKALAKDHPDILDKFDIKEDGTTNKVIFEAKTAGANDLKLSSVSVSIEDDKGTQSNVEAPTITATEGYDDYNTISINDVTVWDGTEATLKDSIFEVAGEKYVVYSSGVTLDDAKSKLLEEAGVGTRAMKGSGTSGTALTNADAQGLANLIRQTSSLDTQIGQVTGTTWAVSGTNTDNVNIALRGKVASSSAGLRLRVGDSTNSYDDISVEIKSLKADKLTGTIKEGKGEGQTFTLDKLNVSTDTDADYAMGALKDMINYVSTERGNLGATQNRLDHTINNLSTMQENIQDAEATIRDVDVAEEMMKYTKNNILVQSAQAMLAQANQLPQGVLQLLG